MAEALFREKCLQGKVGEIEVRSAGLYKFNGTQLSRHSRTVLAEYGIQSYHKPQGINREIIEWADLVLTMTKFHKYILSAIFPEIIDKTFTLKEFVGEQNSLDISDPVGKSLSSYHKCAQEIDRALNLLCHKLADGKSETNLMPLPTPQRLPPVFRILKWFIARKKQEYKDKIL